MVERSVTLHDVIRRRGQTYRLMGRYEEALTDFHRAIELRPDAGWIAAERGQTYRLMDQPEQALADFDQAIELWPESRLDRCRTRGKHHVRAAGRALTRRLAGGCHLPSWALVFPAVAA